MGNPITIFTRCIWITIVIPTCQIRVERIFNRRVLPRACPWSVLRISHGFVLIIWGRYYLFIQYICIRIEGIMKFRICKPSKELVSCSRSCRRTDLISISNTEGKSLSIIISPAKRLIINGISKQKRTVLNLTPLGIHLNAIYRHLTPLIRCRASFIKIPAFKDIPLFTTRQSRNIGCIFFRNSNALSNQTAFMQKTARLVLNFSIITVHIFAIEITDFKLLTIIDKVQVIKSRIITRCPIIAIVPILSSPS